MATPVLTQVVKKNRKSSLKDWHLALLVPLVTLAMCLIPRLFSPTFFYWDDTMQSFLPVWRTLGENLLNGHFELMDPGGWVGGNYMAEVGYGIWNPLNVLNFMAVAMMNDLALASFLVVTEFMAILSLGTFLLTRSYGANKWLSAAAGVAIPFSGFTLFYEAARWPGGLMAFAWVTLFWWSLRRSMHGNRNPLLPFLLGFLTMTSGNPYGAVGVIVVSAAVGIELVLTRKRSRLISIFFLALAVGLTAVLVFFPLPLSAEVTARTNSIIANDMFLVPGIGDLTAMSTPNYRPPTRNFFGILDAVPSAYLAWFILPFLPWLNFRSIGRRSRQISSLYIITIIYFLLTFAPSNILLFRWPVRLIEYTYLGTLVLFMVVLSTGLSATRLKHRLVFSGAIIAFGVYRAWAIYPQALDSQLIGGALIAGLLILSLLLWRRAGFPGVAVGMIIGTAAVLAFQSYAFVPQNPVAALGSPVDAEVLKESTDSYKGNTLQIMSSTGLAAPAFVNGQLLYGNQVLNAGVDDSLNRYSGISYIKFANALCMNYRGETCTAAWDQLWNDASPEIPVPLADVLRLETVVVQKTLLEVDATQLPEGWEIVESDEYRVVLLRQDPLDLPGSVSWASPGISVDSSQEEGDSETVRLSATDSGEIAFARLAWPGYRVTIDGAVQEVGEGPAGVITVNVPRGSAEVLLEFAPPGLHLGLGAMAVGWALALLMSVLHLVRSRREDQEWLSR